MHMLTGCISLLSALVATQTVLADEYFQPFGDTQFVPFVPPTADSVPLLFDRTHVPLGNARVISPISKACSLSINVTARSGTVDVVLLPSSIFDAWVACRADVPHNIVLCSDQPLCQIDNIAANRTDQLVLLVGRSRINRHADATVETAVSGATNTCPGETSFLLRPRLGRHMHFGSLPYSPTTLERREVTECGPRQQLCWLNDSRTRSFLEAARNLRISFNGVAHASLNGLRGVVATRDIAPGEVVMTVPRATALEVSMTRNGSCPFPSFASRAFWASADGATRLALKLLWEKRRGAASRKAGWVGALPGSPDPPWRWRTLDLHQLHYAPLAHKALQQRAAWRQSFAKLKATTPGSNITSAEFYWALDTVKSRAFLGPAPGRSGNEILARAAIAGLLLLLSKSKRVGENGRMAMYCAVIAVIAQGIFSKQMGKSDNVLAIVPGVDLINHAVQPEAVTSDPGYSEFNEQFRLTATTHLKPGQQLFNSYGPHPNDNLLQWYGFVTTDNRDDVYILENLLQRLRGLQHVPHSRLTLLKDLGLAESMSEVVLKRTGTWDEVRPGFRLLFAPLELLLNATASSFQQLLPAPHEAFVDKVLHELLLAERSSKPSSLQEDVALLRSRESVQLGTRQRTALTFRIEKKRLLNDIIAGTQPSTA